MDTIVGRGRWPKKASLIFRSCHPTWAETRRMARGAEAVLETVWQNKQPQQTERRRAVKFQHPASSQFPSLFWGLYIHFLRTALLIAAFFVTCGYAPAVAQSFEAKYDYIIRISNYQLGSHEFPKSVIKYLDSVMVNVNRGGRWRCLGTADATPYRRYSGNNNQALANHRASDCAQLLQARYGIARDSIDTEGEVLPQRGGKYRAIVISHIPSSPSLKATSVESTVGLEDFNALKDSIAALNERFIALRHVTNIVTDDSIRRDPFLGVDVGAGVNYIKGIGADAFAPTVTFFLKPRESPIEFFVGAGIRPWRSGNLCNRMDVTGVLGAQTQLKGPVGFSGGLFTGREACTNGGFSLNERWIDRTNGFFFGPTLNFRLEGINGTVSPSVAMSSTYNAWRNNARHGWGFMLRFDIRTGSNLNNKPKR